MRRCVNGCINTRLINSAFRCCTVKTTPYVKTTSVHTFLFCPSVCDLVAALNHFSYFYEIRCVSSFYKILLSNHEFCENRLLIVIIYLSEFYPTLHTFDQSG
jgi:hypothetical protein